MNNKRGSTAVFLSLILSALIALSLAMIWSAREYSVKSQSDAVIGLAGDSLLGEYHREIFEEYGLFLIDGDSGRLTAGLRGYLGPTFSAMKGISLTGLKADGSRYSIVDPEPVKVQLIAYIKSGGADRIIKTEKSDPDSSGYHNLNHGPTIVSLPSRQLPDTDLVDIIDRTDRLKNISMVFSEGTERYLLGSYVLGTFNNCTGIADRDHFFHNEAEYVLCGKLTDEENEKAILRTIKALRFPPNLAHIYADGEKMSELAAVSESIAPGPLGIALQAALASAWAYAESANDAALLLNGYKVPAIKDKTSWALSLEGLLDSLVESITDPKTYGSADSPAGDPEGGADNVSNGEDQGAAPSDSEVREDLKEYESSPEKMIKRPTPLLRPADDKGMTYEQYLRILLFMKDDSLIVMRILDLIQINVRKNIDGVFIIGEQATGISMEVNVNDRKSMVEKLYQEE